MRDGVRDEGWGEGWGVGVHEVLEVHVECGMCTEECGMWTEECGMWRVCVGEFVWVGVI